MNMIFPMLALFINLVKAGNKAKIQKGTKFQNFIILI